MILSDLNQAVPNHLADESQTRYPDTPPDHPLYPVSGIRYLVVYPVVYPANAFDSRLQGD